MQFYKIEMTINTKDGEVIDAPRERVGRRSVDRDLGKKTVNKIGFAV